MTIGSLFSGIGGLELGLEWAGLGPTVWQVEQDAFCRSVLARHWPEADRTITDVRAATTESLRGVDIVCGGFPCQDVSGAGKGAGLAGARSGLWYEFRRVVGELRPRAVVVENVASGAKRWLCEVRTDLHALGYRTRAVQVSAADIGAPHRRERIFVLAVGDSSGPRLEGREPDERRRAGDGGQGVGLADAFGELVRLEPGGLGGPRGAGEAQPRDARALAYPERGGRDERPGARHDGAGRAEPANGGERQAQSRMGRGPDGLPARLDRWPAGRGEEQHAWEPPRTVEGRQEHRAARLKSLGNAVVPQQAHAVGLVLREWIGHV